MVTSSALTGSSAMMSRGFWMSADGDALALPAGKLVRPARQAFGGQTDLFRNLRDAAAPLGGVVLAVDAQRLL